jgi:hypothetical protein
VIGWGTSKLRHFIDKPNSNSSMEDNQVIPLIFKPSSADENLTDDEKKAQREIEMIATHKRTTICLTRAGTVYACGDKFAKTIKLMSESPLPFGFYALPVGPDLPSPPPDAPSVVAKQKSEKKDESFEDTNFGNLFDEPTEEQPKPEVEKESNEQQKEEDKQLSHSEAVVDLG